METDHMRMTVAMATYRFNLSLSHLFAETALLLSLPTWTHPMVLVSALD